MRLANKIAVIVGAGQSPGEGLGNGRATALRFAEEGASVLCVDRDGERAAETAQIVRDKGGVAEPFTANVTVEADMAAMIARCVELWGRVDILFNNVGVSVAGGDAAPDAITEEAFDRIMTINLRGAVMAVKHALPVMRAQRAGSIVNMSSAAAVENYPYVGYKASKSALVAFSKQIAIQNAEYGIRCNAILPGLLDTPMAVDTRAREWNVPREEIVAERNLKVPLRNRMGTSMDVANAVLFLASDEANFITGVALPVDGGRLVKIG